MNHVPITIAIAQQDDGSEFRLIGQWTPMPYGDDGQFTFGPGDQISCAPRVWWEPLTGCGYISIGHSFHTVIGDKTGCVEFSVDLLDWLVGYYNRTLDHG